MKKKIRDTQGGVFDPRGKGENPWGRAKHVQVFFNVASGDAQQIDA